MKKLILSALLISTFATTAFAGNLWDIVKNSDLQTISPKGYQLKVKGVNTRVYIFNIPEMKSVCTISYGDETSS